MITLSSVECGMVARKLSKRGNLTYIMYETCLNLFTLSTQILECLNKENMIRKLKRKNRCAYSFSIQEGDRISNV